MQSTTNKLTFINLYPFFFKDSGMDTSLMTDGVHLKAKGYLLRGKLLGKYVIE